MATRLTIPQSQWRPYSTAKKNGEMIAKITLEHEITHNFPSEGAKIISLPPKNEKNLLGALGNSQFNTPAARKLYKDLISKCPEDSKKVCVAPLQKSTHNVSYKEGTGKVKYTRDALIPAPYTVQCYQSDITRKFITLPDAKNFIAKQTKKNECLKGAKIIKTAAEWNANPKVKEKTTKTTNFIMFQMKK